MWPTSRFVHTPCYFAFLAGGLQDKIYKNGRLDKDYKTTYKHINLGKLDVQERFNDIYESVKKKDEKSWLYS